MEVDNLKIGAISKLTFSIFILTACSCFADVVSNFDDGTLQGWTTVGENKGVSTPLVGGNPGGCMKVIDKAASTACWALAPTQFLGDWRGKTGVSADLMQPSSTGSQSTGVRFQIEGPGGVYYYIFKEKPPSTWRTFQVNLDPSLWVRKSGSWDALLANVTDFGILMEYVTGDEVTALDNVRLMNAAVTLTIADAKQMPDGTMVKVSGTVSRIFPSFAYIQSDEPSGIRINTTAGLTERNLITVTGRLATQGGERVLNGVTIDSSAEGTAPTAEDTDVADIGGIGESVSDPQLGTSTGPKETGLLIRTYGTVIQTTPSGTFTIQYEGSKVSAVCPAEMAVPVLGSTAIITGISSTIGNPPSPAVLIAHEEFSYENLPLGANIIRNPGAEEGPAGVAGEMVGPIPGWNATGGFTSTKFGYIYALTESTRINGGKNFFFGGINTAKSGVTQDIDVSCLANSIDASRLSAKLSGYMGGRDTEKDYGTIIATFYDPQGKSLGSIQLGPQAASNNSFILWQKSGNVPPKTRCIRITMSGTRIIGQNNDQFYENLSLVLSKR